MAGLLLLHPLLLGRLASRVSTLCCSSSTPSDRRFLAKLSDIAPRRQSGFVVVVEDCQDAQNAAAILRSCDAFAVPECWFIDSRGKAPRFSPAGEEMRVMSASASQWVRVRQFSSALECQQAVRSEGLVSLGSVLPKPGDECTRLPALTGDAAVRESLGPLSHVALWLGSESTGLSATAVAASDRLVTIPMRGAVQSLNLAMSAAMLIAELTRLRATDDGELPRLSAAATAALEDALAMQRAAWHQPHRKTRRQKTGEARDRVMRLRASVLTEEAAKFDRDGGGAS